MGQTWVGLSQRPVSASQLLCTHQQSTQLHIMRTQLLVCAHYVHIMRTQLLATSMYSVIVVSTRLSPLLLASAPMNVHLHICSQLPLKL